MVKSIFLKLYKLSLTQFFSFVIRWESIQKKTALIMFKAVDQVIITD